MPDRSVQYKYLNPNLVTMVTESTDSSRCKYMFSVHYKVFVYNHLAAKVFIGLVRGAEFFAKYTSGRCLVLH